MGAETQVHEIAFQIVEIEGRAISGVKLLGMLTEEQYGQEDFSLYVRWDEAHGIVTVDRSDTDERLITQGLTRVGKLEAFQNLMHLVASKYGTDVVVAADPGLKVSAMAAKMIGTYAAPVAETKAVVENSTTVAANQDPQAFNPTNPATWSEANLPHGWVWVEVGDTGEFHLVSPDGVDVSNVYYGNQDAPTIEQMRTAHGQAMGEWAKPLIAALPQDMGAVEIPTNAPAIDGFEWKRHVNPGESVWAGSTYQLIVAGTSCQVAATVRHRGNGLWAAQTCYWGNAGLTKDFWGGESLADAFASVVAHQDFLSRARAAGLSVTDIARIMDWRTWQAPEVTPLPVRTPGASWAEWDAAEMEIWAGTDQVVKMRFPRKMKKAWRKAHLMDLRMPRPVDVKRARVAKGSVR